MVMPLDWKAFATYPAVSLLSSGVAFLLLVLIAGFGDLGIELSSYRFFILTLAIVFSGFLALGILDATLPSSGIGLRIAMFLHLVDREELTDLVYKTNAAGSITKGVKTIEVFLTALWLVVYFLGP